MEANRNIAVAVRNLAHQFHRYMTSLKLDIASDLSGGERVTDIQGRIISYLYEKPEGEIVYQKDIEKLFNIRRSTATNILNRIENHGLIKRTPCENDARMKTVALTDKARKLCPKVKEEILRAERQAAKGLSEAELDLFFKIVDVMGRNIA